MCISFWDKVEYIEVLAKKINDLENEKKELLRKIKIAKEFINEFN